MYRAAAVAYDLNYSNLYRGVQAGGLGDVWPQIRGADPARGAEDH